MDLIQFIPPPIVPGLAAGGVGTLLALALDRTTTPAPARPGAPDAKSPTAADRWLTASWPVALALVAGFVCAYRVVADRWPDSPFTDGTIGADHRIFWAVLVFGAVAVIDALPRIPAAVRLSVLLCSAYFAKRYVLGTLDDEYTGLSGGLLTLGVIAWFLVMRAGLDVSTRHGSWKPFDAVVVAISIGFMGAALAGSGTLKLGQFAWGLGGAAGAVALGVIFRRRLPTAPAYATVLALSLGSLLLLGIFSGDHTLPWWAAVIVSLAPAARFLSRVGPLGTLKGWPTLVVRALLVLAPAALGAGLAVAATTSAEDLAGM